MNFYSNFTFEKDKNKPVIPLPNPGEGGPVATGPAVEVPVIPLPNPGEGGPVAPGPTAGIPVIPLPNPGEGGPVAPGPTAGKPVIPLPNPGEGGPVAPGPTAGKPVIPLPNPGEGGPVAPGPTAGKPVIPLPNPGEGGPVAPGPTAGKPVIPLPNPGEGGPVAPGPTAGVPVIPLPNPGEGGPVAPGPAEPCTICGIIGTIITSYPRPNSPCKFCTAGEKKTGDIRFLNAAADYNPFMVYLNDELFVNPLNHAEVTEYQKVPMGYQTITVLNQDGYVYIQKPVMVPNNGVITIAIINTESGLDLEVISDAACSRPAYVSCIRACNLSPNAGELNVIIGDNYIKFMNIGYKEVTKYKIIWPGEYSYYVSRSNNSNFENYNKQNILITSMISINANVNYTLYILNWNLSSPDAIRVLIVEEH